jgi:hypothetical protein
VAGIDDAPSVERLAAATRRLAQTIAATEQLAHDRAELLRTADATFGRAAARSNGIALVSLAEAARQTGRNQEVLRRWCADGRVPAVRIGRSWAISTGTLTTLLQHAERSRPRFAPAMELNPEPATG